MNVSRPFTAVAALFLSTQTVAAALVQLDAYYGLAADGAASAKISSEPSLLSSVDFIQSHRAVIFDSAETGQLSEILVNLEVVTGGTLRLSLFDYGTDGSAPGSFVDSDTIDVTNGQSGIFSFAFSGATSIAEAARYWMVMSPLTDSTDVGWRFTASAPASASPAQKVGFSDDYGMIDWGPSAVPGSTLPSAKVILVDFVDDEPTTPVPLPAGLPLVLTGLCVLGLLRARRKR